MEIESSSNTSLENNKISNIIDKKLENKYKNISHLKFLQQKINELDLYNLKEIFKIIKDNEENYTVKKNHILFNLSSLKQETIDEITKFLMFIEKKQEELIKEESIINKFKDIVNHTETN